MFLSWAIVAQAAASTTPAAEAASPLTSALTILFGSGVAGAVVVLFLLGRVESKGAIDRLIADKEKAEQNTADLLLVVNEKYLPAYEAATTRGAEAATALSDAAKAMVALQGVIQQQSEQITDLRVEMARRAQS